MDREAHPMRLSRGFTMIEIVISVAIVAILVAIITPALASARRSARISSSVSNLRQLHLALSLYRSEYGGEGIYGTYAEMGMPDAEQPLDLPGFPVGSPFPSPCGWNPTISDSRPSFEYLYSPGFAGKLFAKNAQLFKDNLIIFADLNCNPHHELIRSEHFAHLGLGVLIGGKLVNQRKKGFVFDADWWSRPPE